MSQPNLILASQSPRRRELLHQLGLAFAVQPADIDESRRAGEPPAVYVQRMAEEKAAAGLSAAPPGSWVLGADTIVLRDESVLGKPADRSDAVKMLTSLAGRSHQVLSAVALAGPAGWQETSVQVSTVRFSDIPPEWIAAWCATDEPMDKAGAYAVQGRTGAFIEHLEGSYSSVMGLPLAETAQLLMRAGFRLPAE